MGSGASKTTATTKTDIPTPAVDVNDDTKRGETPHYKRKAVPAFVWDAVSRSLEVTKATDKITPAEWEHAQANAQSVVRIEVAQCPAPPPELATFRTVEELELTKCGRAAGICAVVQALGKLRTCKVSGCGDLTAPAFAVHAAGAAEESEGGADGAGGAGPELDHIHLHGWSRLADVRPFTQLRALTTLSITKCFGLKDISPIAAIPGLRALFLDECRGLTDVGVLAGAATLERLSLWRTAVTDLAPVGKIPTLKFLSIHDTNIKDVAPLSGLANLLELNVSATPVRDVAPLGALTTLQTLDVSNTLVSALQPLATLCSLVELDIQRSNVQDVTGLEGMVALRTLHAAELPLESAAGLKHLPALQSLDLHSSRVQSLDGWGDGFKALKHLHLANTNIKTVVPIYGLDLESLQIFGTDIAEDEQMLADIKKNFPKIDVLLRS